MKHTRKRIISPKPWTPGQLTLLETLREAGTPWDETATACGHSAGSCSTTLSMLRRRRREAAGEGYPPPGRQRTINGRPWSDSDVKILIRMRKVEGRTFPEIDIALNRAEGASCSKWSRMRSPEVKADVAPKPRPAPQARLYHTDLTAELFGDPLPGRSALDRKRAAGEVSA